MPIKYILLPIFLILSFDSWCQDQAYARSIIDTLSSKSFFGRGYINHGDSLASEFIKKEFERIGLHKINNSYFQTYSHSVNTFPGVISLKFDSEELIGGSQYLVDPASSTGDGKYSIDSISFGDVESGAWVEKIKKSKKKILSIDLSDISYLDKKNQLKFIEFSQYLKFEEDIPAKGLIVYYYGKQPWYISDKQGYRPIFQVFKDSVISSPKEATICVENKFIENYRSKNVIGYVAGKSDTAIFITAHYDHLGMMGKELYFPGANDNASGVALILDLANYFQKNPLEYSVYFIAFSGEEAGLKGSEYFVNNPTFPLNKIKFLLNIDLAGTGIDGATVVNGQIFKDEFEVLSEINKENQYLKTIKSRGEACNSDHCLFYQKGVKCFYIYTLGGTIYYHDIFDASSTLPLNEYGNYFMLLRDFIKKI